MTKYRSKAAVTLAVLLASVGALAAPGAPPIPVPTVPSTTAAPVDDDTAKARALFAEGLTLSKSMQWNDALLSFERSWALKKHAATSFNVGFCQRALGRYVEARASFGRALAENADAGRTQLPETTVEEITRYQKEINALLVKLEIRVKPAGAKILLDGVALVPQGKEAPEGAPRMTPDGGLALDVNPGSHVLTISAKGFGDVVLNKSFAPGVAVSLPVDLAQLPARIHVESNIPAYVRIDGKEVGMTPIDTERPPGEHRIEVERDGYVSYASTVKLDIGGRADLRATLVAQTIPLTHRWWFWTGATAVVLGGVTLTYMLSRPKAEPPPYEGGRLGWVVAP